MKIYEKALEYDRAGQTMNAIKYYELSIFNNENTEYSYRNLLPILVEINTDYGFSSHLIGGKQIDEKGILQMHFKLESAFEECRKSYPQNNDFLAWNYYNKSFYGSLERKEILKIIETDCENLLPYFLLYLFDLNNNIPSSNYIEKIILLKTELIQEHTHRSRFVSSLLEGAEKNR